MYCIDIKIKTMSQSLKCFSTSESIDCPALILLSSHISNGYVLEIASRCSLNIVHEFSSLCE